MVYGLHRNNLAGLYCCLRLACYSAKSIGSICFLLFFYAKGIRLWRTNRGSDVFRCHQCTLFFEAGLSYGGITEPPFYLPGGR